MSDLFARILLTLLRPVGLMLARWRFASLDRRHRRLVARLLTRPRYARLLEIYAMPVDQIANYVQKTLVGAGMTNASTTAVLSDVAGLPTVGSFRLVIKDVAPATTFEIVEVASVNVGTATVTFTTPFASGRGLEGTAAIAHNAGALVGNDVTAGMLNRAFALSQYSAMAFMTTAQLLPATGVMAILHFDTITSDPNANYDVVTNKGRYTCPVAGRYWVGGGFAVVTTNTTLELDIYKNGALYKRIQLFANTIAGAYIYGSGFVKCAAGDFIELAGGQGAAAQNTNTTSSSLCWMDVQYMGQ